MTQKVRVGIVRLGFGAEFIGRGQAHRNAERTAVSRRSEGSLDVDLDLDSTLIRTLITTPIATTAGDCIRVVAALEAPGKHALLAQTRTTSCMIGGSSNAPVLRSTLGGGHFDDGGAHFASANRPT